MNIPEVLGKLKSSAWSPECFVGILILLVGFGSFGLGRLSALERVTVPIRVETVKGWGAASVSEGAGVSSAPLPQEDAGGAVVGSKNGDKYHFPWCAGAQRIKEGNKVYFSSIEEARAAGYTPAANCKGLK